MSRIDHGLESSIPRWLNEPVRQASTRVPYRQLVRIELFRLVGVPSSCTVFLVAIALDLGSFLLLYSLSSGRASAMASALNQIGPGVQGTRLTQVAVLAPLVVLVAGEWQHRSVQTTLLAQPSRLRYLFAQVGVAGLIWLVGTILHAALILTMSWVKAEKVGAVAILVHRPIWTLAAVALGLLTSLVIALLVAAILPNVVAALVVYALLVPLSAILEVAVPRAVVWVDPFTASNVMIDSTSTGFGPWPVVSSVVLWLVVGAYAVQAVSQRDAA